MDSLLQGQAHVPHLSDQIPTSLTCPNCSLEFPSRDAIVGHLATEGSCGRWLVETLPGMEQPPAAADVNYNEDLDALHDMEGWDSNNDRFNDDTDGSAANREHSIEFPDIYTDQIDPSCSVGTGRKRIFHPNEGKARSGGLNHVQRMDRDQFACVRNQENVYYPFACQSEWELANWLSSGSLSQKEINQYLHSCRNLEHPVSFRTAQDLRGRIESLPDVPRWRCQEIKVGPYKTKEPLMLYWRDGLEVIEHLFGDPTFASSMDFGPYREFEEGPTGQERIYSEFMSGDHAWDIQSSLPNGHSFVGVIGASDKTPLTLGSGNKEMHPLLLSLANIHADVRMKASSHAFALAAYLPIPKFLNVSPAIQSVLSARVYHFAISIVMKNLKKATKEGIVMSDPNGLLRLVHTPLVSWIADRPEQLVIACSSSKYSPISVASTEHFGEATPYPLRDRQATLDAIREACRMCDPCDIAAFHKVCLSSFHLNGVVLPFWADWGDACPSMFLTPDALHQWHKFYYDHCVRWVINMIGGAELDRRLSVLQPRTGNRRWPNGVSTLKQTSGKDHRDLEKVLPVVAAGAVPNDVLCALRAITEFIFLAQSVHFFDETLHALREALREFHHYKSSIIAAGGRQGKNGPLNHFRIPKLEMALHVERSVRTMGAAYQWTSDITERCHITHVKIPYRLSNHRNFHEQCCRFLDRQEKQRFFQHYTTLKTAHAPLINEIVGEMELMHLYRAEPTSGPANSTSGLVDDSADAYVGSNEQPIGLPSQKGSIFDKRHARISADMKSAILLATHPHFRDLDIDVASQTLGLTDLRPALGDFFSGRSYRDRTGRRYAALNCPLPFTTLHAWNKFRIQHHSVQNPLSFVPPQTVQAVPPSPALPFGRANTVLLAHESGELISANVNSERYVVAQVRAILQPRTIPPSDPLLYVQFFSFSPTHIQVLNGIRVATPAPHIEMFLVRRRVRNDGHFLGDIVHLDDVRQVVQLVPKFGSQVPENMTCDNSLEIWGEFYVNSFADKETFHAILSYQ